MTAIPEALTVHTYLENEVMYPEVRRLLPDRERDPPIEEEEQDWFPKVRAGLGRRQLQELGEGMARLRPGAPRTPTDPAAVKSATDAVTA